MKKVFVVIIDDKPYVFGTLGMAMQQIAASKLPFEPDVHEVVVQRREYSKKSS